MGNIAKSIPKRFWEDEEWAYKHYAALWEKYPNHWVAIYRKRVVAASKGLGRASALARKKTGQLPVPLIYIASGRNVYQALT
jgi:hypothetical protein